MKRPDIKKPCPKCGGRRITNTIKDEDHPLGQIIDCSCGTGKVWNWLTPEQYEAHPAGGKLKEGK